MSAVASPDPVISFFDGFVRDSAALSAEIDGEAVALHVANGACFGFDAIATHIWTLLASPITVEAICADLMTVYDVEPDVCRDDVLHLLGALRSEGLIRLVTASSLTAA